MPCYHPITGYRSRFVNPSGKRSIVFNTQDGFSDLTVQVPCGKCTGCRLEYSRQWAMRCVHESQMHEENAFITLTYDNDHLPANHSINKKEIQDFIKRLRFYTDVKLRYFACGEYGEKKHRPHYHAIIFGYDFPDKKLHTKQNGHLLYRSELLEKAWTKGHSLIGHCTFESAAYVARYIMKKRVGKNEKDKSQDQYYEIIDDETGEIHQQEREFCLMSRRPGIGKTWLETYHKDTDKDFLTLRGKKMKLPKYYDNILELEDEIEMLYRKGKRRRLAKQQSDDNTIERLETKERVKDAQINQLKRSFEEL